MEKRESSRSVVAVLLHNELQWIRIQSKDDASSQTKIEVSRGTRISLVVY